MQLCKDIKIQHLPPDSPLNYGSGCPSLETDCAVFQVFGAINKCGSIQECAGHIQYLTMNEFVQDSQLAI